MIRFTKDAKLENLVERPSESLPKIFSKFGSDLVSSMVYSIFCSHLTREIKFQL